MKGILIHFIDMIVLTLSIYALLDGLGDARGDRWPGVLRLGNKDAY